MYTQLRPQLLLSTLGALDARIKEWFPGSGLSQLSTDLGGLAGDTIATSERLRRPIWPLRLGSVISIALVLVVTAWLVGAGLQNAAMRIERLPDFLQASEAAVNELILLAIAIYFFASLELRAKRRR